MHIKQISAIETYPLRADILNWNQHYDSLALAADNEPTTMHLGCFCDASDHKKPIGIVTLIAQSIPTTHISLINQGLQNEYRWRLRGMAVDPHFQRQSVASNLLNKVKSIIPEKQRLWANVRWNAVTFFQKAHFVTVGQKFLIGTIGYHYIMIQAESDQ